MPHRAVFLDRDGTINEEVCYLSHVNQLRLIDGAGEAIRLLNESGFKVVVVTNQSGVARRYFPEETVEHVHNVMQKMLRAADAHIDAIYYCPHHPTEGIGPYQIECDCRKPQPGMLKTAAEELDVDLSRCFIVGDKISDLEAGHEVGCRTVLVRTGYGVEMEKEFRHYTFQPDYVANDILEASRWILTQST